MTVPNEALRRSVLAAVEAVIPTKMVVWPTPYDRRYGELDAQDRFALVQTMVETVLDLLFDSGREAES